MTLLRRVAVEQVARARVDPVDARTLSQAAEIIAEVRAEGEPALRRVAERLGDIEPGAPLVRGPEDLRAALRGLPAAERELLERTAGRVRRFAEAQRAALQAVQLTVSGGEAGHQIAPLQRAGCYAPGGRFPLPSSVLMTAVTARAARVETVWVASPRPTNVTLAAAAVAGADALLAVGGAQAIAALAYGAGPVPACDAVVGPGNRWVTAAKKLVAGHVAIDMLAGPSELVVLADHSADPRLVAADLLAQAEHDEDAFTALVTPDGALADAVEAELDGQLRTLPTASTARAALANGLVVVADTLAEAAMVCNRLAPEHLEVQVENAEAAVPLLTHFGALFVGPGAAEVFGDYGVGPNHVLPTSGTARSTGGLSVFTFLRVRTWLKVTGQLDAELRRDAAAFARLEGLEAHARAAELRARKTTT